MPFASTIIHLCGDFPPWISGRKFILCYLSPFFSWCECKGISPITLFDELHPFLAAGMFSQAYFHWEKELVKFYSMFPQSLAAWDFFSFISSFFFLVIFFHLIKEMWCFFMISHQDHILLLLKDISHPGRTGLKLTACGFRNEHWA